MRWPNSSVPGWAAAGRTWWACRSGPRWGCSCWRPSAKLVDRAVLCGTVINTMPVVRLTALLLGLVARNTLYRWVINRYRNARLAGVPSAKIDDYREDVRLITGGQLAHIVEASAGFTLPEGLDKSDSPTLFRHRRQGDAGRPPFGCSARAANAQRSRQGRNRNGPRLAAALSRSLLPHRRRLALRYGPASRDRIAELGSSLTARKFLANGSALGE